VVRIMYQVHPRNLTLGPFLTLLFTLSPGSRMSTGLAGRRKRDCSLSETAPANAHEAALQQFIADEGCGDRSPFILGPFLTLILTLRTTPCGKSGTTKEEMTVLGRSSCQRPSWADITS
jgi:hypothetical protein